MIKQINTQSGVALMMSVLILAAVTAISFSLATIVFIELRASRDVVRSEPALYATLGVTEEALFQYKRFVDSGVFDVSSCYPKALSVCELNGVELDNPLPQVLTESEVPFVETIYAGQTKEYPLFTLTCSQQDPDCSWDSVIGAMGFELVPIGNVTAPINIKADWIDLNGATGSDTIATGMNENSDRIDWPVPVLTNRQYIVKITNTDPEQNVQMSIWSYQSGSTTKTKGLPFITSNVLKIVANYSGLTRAYRVDIPFGDIDFGDITSNVALASNGGIPTAYSQINGSFNVESVNNGIVNGSGWGNPGGGWNSFDAASIGDPEWVEINFSSQKTISRIDVYTLTNTWPIEPITSSTPANLYGIADFELQYETGGVWVTPPGGNITGNSLAWRTVSFTPVTATAVRVHITADRASYSRVVELEAYGN